MVFGPGRGKAAWPCEFGVRLYGSDPAGTKARFVRFETRHSGLLVVRKDGELLSMDFPALFPEGLRKSAGATDLRSRTGLLASKVLEVNDTCIAVYEDESTIQTMQPDFARLEQLHPFAVSVTAPGRDGDFVSRYFKPSYGLPEDPANGSVDCALTP